MRKKIVAGNWKMNNGLEEARTLTAGILTLIKPEKLIADHIILAPPFPYLSLLKDLADANFKIKISAQNCSSESSGAFTGEVSASMIQSVGAIYVIVGHSERRNIYSETDELIARKIKLVHENGLTSIFCCGESISHRKEGNQFDVVKQQIEIGLFQVPSLDLEKVVIAYEPVWAIGTGETASAEQAQEMHFFIRSLIENKYGKHAAGQLSILYGGSCNEKNANELFALPDVDGGLIGGASLKADSFVSIVKSFS